MKSLRLGVNIDHVATVRNARGGATPDPIRAALIAQAAGADGITAHLREDRRHISDEDIARLSRDLEIPLNLEMAATEEMLAIALKARPHAACIVPEKREERTTEGGIDVVNHFARLKPIVGALGASGHPGVDVHRARPQAARRLAGTGRAGGGTAHRRLCQRQGRGAGKAAEAYSQCARSSAPISAWKSMPAMASLMRMSSRSPRSPISANSISAIS